jgi:uncharacterized protein with HEPN domain
VSKSWQIYALHILDVGAKIERIQARGDITQDEVLYDAMLRNLQTLSEATQMLPDSLKSASPNVPWREVSGFRNILVHNYLGDIDSMTVLLVVKNHLPPLIDSVRAMLASDGHQFN